MKKLIDNLKKWDLNTFTFITIIFALTISFTIPKLSMLNWSLIVFGIGYPIGLVFAYLGRDK